MVDIRRFLHRLRPAGAPGAAAGAAVPADRRALLEAELAGVFAALADTGAECEQVRREAVERSARLAAEAAGFAARTVAAADAEAPSLRVEAMDDRLREARRDSLSVVAAAERDAVRVAQHASRAIPALVEAVVGEVRRRGGES